ncbi:uncharacterized protein PSMG1 [Tribolium castaneum]|uniref:Proteasome assembly chaperone 1 n=1 Tax=Tribolium castaneum TaxID=7070 RepID=A0A139WMK3_TRICA|nr:PREDICTED: uncharacterized protein LOC103315206 [Tribolium castaneum]KYB29278.1 hypothetical protein TcasGA2_TC032171 [Tribolium castaneum]|eukprot:XP_008201519.1 PREDICTED: uncharacterized protein LOC103315206 [Tribolium castaneum]
MVFGEIVEPSTRALIDDEYEEYSDYIKPELKWEGTFKAPPDLDTLIFVEGSKILTLFNALILKEQDLVCMLKVAGLQIFNGKNGKYIISYSKNEITTGEIIEELVLWLRKAAHIYGLTSESAASYQNLQMSEKPETLIRKLSTEINLFPNYKKLESPNLVSGLGADILSFCIHTGLKATLFVVYMDSSPLDSINTTPIIQLIKLLDLDVNMSCTNLNPVPSNLYL